MKLLWRAASCSFLACNKALWIVSVVLAGSSFSAQAADVWDAATDFSSTLNSNGQWTYGVFAGSYHTFIDARASGYNQGVFYWNSPETNASIGYNGTDTTQTPFLAIDAVGTVVPSHTLVLHPGLAGEEAVLRWTAPYNGQFNLSASFSPLVTFGVNAGVQINLNQVSLFSDSLTGNYSPLYGQQWLKTFASSITLAKGDVIDFVVSQGKDQMPLFDSTGVIARVEAMAPVPEPEIYATLLAGLGLLGAFARRRKSL